MKELFFIAVCIYILVTLIFLSVDFYGWWMERYPRYKIGRWNDEKKWIDSVYKKGKKWLPVVPAVPVSQNRNLILLDILKGKYTRKSVQAWQTGGLLTGVCEFSNKDSEDVLKQTLKHFTDENGQWKESPQNVDFGILAYSFLKNTDDSEKIKPAMDEVLELILAHKGEDELIFYTHDKKTIRYVDTLGLVCPFLALYGKVYQRPDLQQLAVRQLENFTEKGLFKDSFLPAHSYRMDTGLPVGVYGWGRGTVWMLLGLTDTYLELEDETLKKRIETLILSAAEKLKGYRRENGGYGRFLQLEGLYDSSATAGMAYFYSVCYRITQNEEYRKSAESSLNCLMKFTRRDGSLDYCQGDTVDVGIFSQRLDIMPFAQGMLLKAYSVLNSGFD